MNFCYVCQKTEEREEIDAIWYGFMHFSGAYVHAREILNEAKINLWPEIPLIVCSLIFREFSIYLFWSWWLSAAFYMQKDFKNLGKIKVFMWAAYLRFLMNLTDFLNSNFQQNFSVKNLNFYRYILEWSSSHNIH